MKYKEKAVYDYLKKLSIEKNPLTISSTELAKKIIFKKKIYKKVVAKIVDEKVKRQSINNILNKLEKSGHIQRDVSNIVKPITLVK